MTIRALKRNRRFGRDPVAVSQSFLDRFVSGETALHSGGRFGGVLEAVLPSVSVAETFPKWTESGFNRS